MQQLTPTLVSWASMLEDTTRAQAERTAGMPFIHPHVALMPDAHLGLGATVGSVIPTGSRRVGVSVRAVRTLLPTRRRWSGHKRRLDASTLAPTRRDVPGH